MSFLFKAVQATKISGLTDIAPAKAGYRSVLIGLGIKTAGKIQSINPNPATPVAPVAALGAAGVLTGAYTYKVTFMVNGAESTGGVTSNSVAPAAQQIALSAIPLGPVGTTQRKLYRTAAGGADLTQKFLATLNDNVTTVYNDNIADAALGAAYPAVGGIQDITDILPDGYAFAMDVRSFMVKSNVSDKMTITGGTGFADWAYEFVPTQNPSGF